MVVKIEGEEGLVKDPRTNAILLDQTRKKDEYLAARAEAKRRMVLEQEVSEIKKEMNGMKNNIEEILRLLNGR